MNKGYLLLVVLGAAALLYLFVQQPLQEEAQPSVSEVLVDEYFFYPDEVTVEAGGKVVWANEGLSKHTVTFDFFSSPLLGSGESWEHVFDEPGDYGYYSAVDVDMRGTVHVTE